MPDQIKVSVVIGSYQLKDKLKLVLDSFSTQTFPLDHFEVVVVDSGSSDGTHEMLEKYAPPFSFKYYIQPNKGKSSARNRGVKESRGDLIIITDADMIASTYFIQAHVEMHQRFKLPILVQGKTWVLSEESLPVENYRRRPYITHKVVDGQVIGFYYCLTGNLSLSRQIYLDVGGLDETFTGYGWEDIDLGIRLIKGKKLELHYSDQAVNDHFHVWSEMDEWKRRYKMGQSVSAVLAKHPSLKNFLGLHILNRFLYRVVPLIPRWNKLIQGSASFDPIHLSRFDRVVLREYYYQLGYFEPIPSGS